MQTKLLKVLSHIISGIGLDCTLKTTFCHFLRERIKRAFEDCEGADKTLKSAFSYNLWLGPPYGGLTSLYVLAPLL